MFVTTARIAMLLGILAAPLALAQDDPESENDQLQAGEESVGEGDGAAQDDLGSEEDLMQADGESLDEGDGASESTDEAAADEGFDQDAVADPPDEMAGNEDSGDGSSVDEAFDQSAGDKVGNSGSDADASADGALPDTADSEAAASDPSKGPSPPDDAVSTDATADVVSPPGMAQVSDFSGTWTINNEKSTLFEQYSLAPSQLILTQSADSLTVEKHGNFQGTDYVTNERFGLNGAESINPGMMPESRKTSVAVWSENGKILTISSRLPTQTQGEVTQKEVYQMIGDSLRLEFTSASSMGEMAETYVFDKQ